MPTGAPGASEGEHDPVWLTVVMPVHEGAEYLEATLESVAAEGGAGVELILTDSSKDDRCRVIVDRFRQRLAIRYSHRPDIKPWTQKTNRAVAEATAPHVAMLHQDDLWLPGRLAAVRQSLARHPHAALHLFPSRLIDGRGRDIGGWQCPLGGTKTWTGPEFAERLIVQNFVAIPAPVIRRDLWLAAQGLDEALWYTADWDLYLKLAARGEVVCSPVATTAFRVHGQSLTVQGSRDIRDFEEQLRIVVDRHCGTIKADRRDAALRLARVSMAVNVALAGALSGNARSLPRALAALLSLSPAKMVRFFQYSRLWERVWPRLRLRIVGSL